MGHQQLTLIAATGTSTLVSKQGSGQCTTASTTSNSIKTNDLGGMPPFHIGLLYRIRDLKGKMTKSNLGTLLGSLFIQMNHIKASLR